jgi:hypothetical protein
MYTTATRKLSYGKRLSSLVRLDGSFPQAEQVHRDGYGPRC